VLTTPVKISQSLLMKYNEAVGDISCPGDNKKGIARNAEVAEEAGPKQSEAGSAVFRPPPKDARKSTIESTAWLAGLGSCRKIHGACMLFMACAWHVHGMCMACAWHVHGMHGQ
jgi:hypothetical protein